MKVYETNFRVDRDFELGRVNSKVSINKNGDPKADLTENDTAKKNMSQNSSLHQPILYLLSLFLSQYPLSQLEFTPTLGRLRSPISHFLSGQILLLRMP